MITVTCAHCGLQIQVPESVQGRQGLCLNCDKAIVVPVLTGAPPTARVEFQQGDRIGDRYAILSHIGSGGMGVVYHAQDTLVKEDVALKFLRPTALRTEKGRRLFLQEAQIARRLRHENIIAVHDVGFTSDGVMFLSMEYAPGQSLRELLMQQRQEKRYLAPRLVVAIMVQALDGLQYAHRLVVHRDLKPENILMLKNEHVKVLDFGLALAIEAEEAEEKPKAGQGEKRVIGTLAYASPEQKRHHPIDLRADIYAMGLIMRELLSLRTPLELKADAPLSRDDVAPNVMAVMYRALREDKNDRWQSAQDFREALQSAFDASYQVRPAAIGRGDSTRTRNTDGMVYFEGGAYLMGNDAIREEAPELEVVVAPFWMDIHPVTVAQYEKYMKDVGAAEPKFWHNPVCNGPDQPIVGLSWEEARAFASWAGKQLPTETQWEFAARGRANRKYPWGHLPPDPTRCNFNNFLGMPSMVSMHEDGKTPEGLLDMAGNVYEWTCDPYAPYDSIRAGAEGLQGIPRKSARGGCFESPPSEMTTTARKGLFPNVQQMNVGFRCVICEEG